jgi:NAD(P)-dependent dehydrogenase (short-subunit alcohol dehydrogenase family)
VAYPDIAGKVAIVTGAAGGIGKALVAGFVKEGLRVAALDIDEKGVRALQDKYGDAKVLGRAQIHGSQAGGPARLGCSRSGFHRLLHERADRGLAQRGGGRGGPQGA